MAAIVDSGMGTIEAFAINPAGDRCPQEIMRMQMVICVSYYSFDGLLHNGRIVVDRRLAGDVARVFGAIERERFPVMSAIPVADARIGWSDDVSMAANNSSGFNYRPITGGGTRVSAHALGQAIDINPLLNPYVSREGIVSPPGAVRDVTRPGTILEDSFLVRLFESMGWEWGGRWTDRVDWHHFEKRL